MKIEIGKWYKNKTWRFLLPCLKGHGMTFVNKFNPVFKLGVAIHDTLLDGSSLAKGRNILIVCDKKYQEKSFLHFLDWVQYQPYFKGDYCPDVEIKTTRKHIIILEIPEEFNNAYDHFVKGEYSKMYTSEQLEHLFSHQSRAKDKQVLLKNKNLYPELAKKVNQTFSTSVTENDFNNSEVELPLNRQEEILNCKKEQRVYFNEKLDKIWQ